MAVELSSISLPKKPGVYLFKNHKGRVLYVGKATKLSERIRSYFAKNPDRAMIPELVKKSDDIECIVTASPHEALILERQLIREHKPRYNSMLKDDKSFPYLALTSDDLPRILYSRRPPKNAVIWGPFPNAGAAKQVMKLLRRQFGLRDEKNNIPFGYLDSGNDDDYRQRILAVKQILNGNASSLIESLTRKMDQYSENLEYEVAARQRDLIKAIRTTTSQHIVSSKVYRDCDAIGFASEGDLAAVVVLHADDGVVKGQESWQMIHREDIGETISMFVSDHYANRIPPKLLLTPTPLFDGVEDWLQTRRDSAVEVRNPSRGDLVTLMKLATQNAEIQLIRFVNKTSGSLEKRAADDGAKLLGMQQMNHIVCFDMAQIQGEHRVGASVCFKDGRPHKEEYRKYTVKGEQLDDLRMMREVVQRWMKHQTEWPDLLLLDGGRTHLKMISEMIEQSGNAGKFAVAALAKREETVFRKDKQPIILDRRGRVLIHARDEAHRFVNTFHRKRRKASKMVDPLEKVPGLGAKKFQTLIRHFGGRKEVLHASEKDIKTVPGIGPALARRIFEAIND
jgi:excinuclease ABC subunit C|tara:strand:+ start:905 stop:2605 length:1701 start_codon:yes stop_codon:yes gene_type:complete